MREERMPVAGHIVSRVLESSLSSWLTDLRAIKAPWCGNLRMHDLEPNWEALSASSCLDGVWGVLPAPSFVA